jgi:hypothetical protein
MDWYVKANKAAELLLTIGITIFLIFIICTNIFHFNYIMNADLASDTVLAKLIWTSKEIIPDSWFIAAETRIIGTPNFGALFYGLTGNMALSEGLACCLMTFFILAGIFYFGKKAKLKKTETMLLAFLGLALSANMAILELLYLFASYYAIHTAVLFFTLGIYVEGIREKRLKLAPVIFSMALALCLGIQGVRGILVIYGPMFGMEAIRVIYRGISLKTVTGGHILKSWIDGVKGEKADWVLSLWVTALLVFSFIGTCFPFSVGQTFSRNIRNGMKKLITVVLPNMRKAASFDQVNLFGKVCLVILFLMVFYLLTNVLYRMWKKKDIEAAEWGFLVICASPVVTALIVSFTTFDDTERYYFLLVYAMAFGVVLAGRRLKQEWKVIGGFLIAAFVAANINTVYLPIIRSQEPPASELHEVGNYLIENDYHTAYATFENANTLTVLTNGKVQVSAVASVEKMDICKWMSSTDWYVPNMPFEDKTAYIITKAEAESFAVFLETHKEEVEFAASIGKYSIYTSNYNFSVLE